MNVTQKILLLLIIVTFRSSSCQDDLLDRYVQHVDRVNRVVTNTNNNYLDNRSKSRNQRVRRSVSTSFSVVSEDLVSDDVSRKVIEENASGKIVKAEKVKEGKFREEKVKQQKVQEEKVQEEKIQEEKFQEEKVQERKVQEGKWKDPKLRYQLSKKHFNPVPARKTKLDGLWSEAESRIHKGETRRHKDGTIRRNGHHRSSSKLETTHKRRKINGARRERSVDFGMNLNPTNGMDGSFIRSPTKKVLPHNKSNHKKIKSNFTPDLKPYLDRLSSEVSSNDLDDNEENFRRKRDIGNDLNQWTHAEILDSEGDVILRWQLRHQEISFRVEARTRGYIGIGFSPNGRMEGADMVVGWVDDKIGKAYLNDYHGAKDKSSEPVKDEIDNYTLLRGEQNDTHTTIEFRRALDTCDPDDYVLTADTVRVIWATHGRDPRPGLGLVFHEENRGSQSLHLLGPGLITKSDNFAQVRQWDVTLNNFEVKNNMDTIYWCKIFKAPVLQKKHHVISFEPLIGKNHTKLVHHMLLHECKFDDSTNYKKWEAYARESGRPCYEDVALDWEKCMTPVIAWAVGSKGEEFPNHVGIPIGEKTTSFYRLEVHFDNPGMKQAVDTSGLRIHYTNKLRENDGGILVTGITLSPLHIIPPKQVEFKSAGYCSTDCTEKMFPKDGINVVSVLLHSHLAGRKLKLRHIRGEQELPPIAEDNHYDFNYQQSRMLSQDIKVLPGDGLVTECTYNTRKRSKVTFGGYSTQQEMCLAFVLHYPRTELAGCYSMPPVTYFFDTLGVKKFYGKDNLEVEKLILQGSSESPLSSSSPRSPLFTYQPGDENSPEANQKAILALQNAKAYTIETDKNSASVNILDQLIIEEPSEFRNKSFMSHLDALPYEEPSVTQKIEEYFYRGLHLTFCRKKDDTLAMDEAVIRFPTFKPYSSNETKVQCSYRMRHSTSTGGVSRISLSSSLRLSFTLFLIYFLSNF